MNQTSKEVLIPMLKWAGGKRWLMQRYSKLLEEFNDHRWVEPFAGGLAASLSLRPARVLANDINPHLINFYEQIKQQRFTPPQDLCLSQEYFYELRQEFNELIATKQHQTPRAATLFWTLNRLGYNGLCRFNKLGFFNTPVGFYKKVYTDFQWEKYTELFERWTFECGSFLDLTLSEQDFLFCDPPYDRAWQGYVQEKFSFELHEQLAQWVASQSAPAMLMNYPTERILNLYEHYGFEIFYVSAPRTIGSNGAKRKPCSEIIATHNFSWKERVKKL